ncbi:ADP-ribosylglycohydrolase-domain-containing protein [Zalerion maritima]|uniref:ADP-ribosylglycohydrolase-domain-containing protein n=1 Tax=Zalerion maritima TaxID=339359 RepID=A0AAD5RGZ8_9PEZI|nr:ADP-ribosylglycohydrolase-domain-containing protein [Zalerion maritima]
MPLPTASPRSSGSWDSRGSILSRPPPVYSSPYGSPPPSYASRTPSSNACSLDYLDDSISVNSSASNPKRLKGGKWVLRDEKFPRNGEYTIHEVDEKKTKLEEWLDDEKERGVLKKPCPEKQDEAAAVWVEPRRKRRGLMCLGLCWVSRRTCYVITGTAALVVLVAAIVPPVVIFAGANDGAGAGGNATSTVVVTSTSTDIQTATSTTVVTQTPTPTTDTEDFLGGFDTLRGTTFGDPLFYTDQDGDVRQIDESGSANYWVEASPYKIARDAMLGSPVQAVLDGNDQAYVFYVSDKGKLKGLVTASLSTTSVNEWYSDTIADLEIEVAVDDPFLRVCMPDLTTYYAATNGTSLEVYMVLMLRGADGAIARYGARGGAYESTTGIYESSWIKLEEEVPFGEYARAIECAYSAGDEGMWVVTEDQTLQYWAKNTTIEYADGSPDGTSLSDAGDEGDGGLDLSRRAETTTLVTGWERVITYSEKTHPNTSLLAVASGYENTIGRQHLVFQDEDDMLVRLDVTGHGIYAELDESERVISATPGTRLSTWATTGYCGDIISVYYQRDGTSAVHFMTFVDDYYGSSYQARTSEDDRKMPIVETYGEVVEPGENGAVDDDDDYYGGGGSGAGLAVGSIVGIVVGVLVFLCCCCGCFYA